MNNWGPTVTTHDPNTRSPTVRRVSRETSAGATSARQSWRVDFPSRPGRHQSTACRPPKVAESPVTRDQAILFHVKQDDADQWTRDPGRCLGRQPHQTARRREPRHSGKPIADPPGLGLQPAAIVIPRVDQACQGKRLDQSHPNEISNKPLRSPTAPPWHVRPRWHAPALARRSDLAPRPCARAASSWTFPHPNIPGSSRAVEARVMRAPTRSKSRTATALVMRHPRGGSRGSTSTAGGPVSVRMAEPETGKTLGHGLEY